MKVDIPFLPRWQSQMLEGRKTCTARTTRWGSVGDTFEKSGATFVIVNVLALPLKEVAEIWFEKEGVSSPEEYRAVWKGLHRFKGYVPDQIVWLHEFKRVP